jgi:broad specificity phosphatase PhoE
MSKEPRVIRQWRFQPPPGATEILLVRHGESHQVTQSRPFAFIGADNGSISHVVITDERWILRRFNETSHLQPTMTTAPEPLT